MSREELPLAPPAEAFRNSVLTSITEEDNLSSPSSNRRGKRARNELFPQQPPPPLRRSSSLGGSTISNQQSFAKPLLRRRSSLFDSLPGRSRTGSLQTVPETNPPSFFQRFSQNSTLLADADDNNDDDVSTSNLSVVGTPQRRPRGSLFGAVMEKLGTNASPEPGFVSPSGKSILNIVNRITSPFRFHSPPAKRRLLSSPKNTPKQPEDSQSSMHDDDNWREAPIHNGQAEIVDWTLKRKLQMECHPPEALANIWQTREWIEALGYWEYSSTAVLDPVPLDREPQPEKKDKTKNSKAPEKQEPKDPEEELASRLLSTVRAGKNTTPSREWQQSFRSLFLQWRRRVEAEENAITSVLNHYFYAVSEEHVVLFRVDIVNHQCQPRVLLSKCGEHFRQALRDSGIDTMTVLKEPISPSAAKDKNKDNPMSPTVKADLEALRKAQAFGEVAGAEVAIKIKAHKKGEKLAASQSLAITLAGYDNVASFFEVYFNRFGRVQDKDDVVPRTFPKLFCPIELGPFWHSSFKVLEVYPVKPKAMEAIPNGILEVHGAVILPSLIRRLLALSASKLSVLHSNHPTESSPLTIRSPLKEKAGSHYVVLHTVEEEESILVRPKASKKGMERASILFNSIDINNDVEEEGDSDGVTNQSLSECRSGTTLQLIVWDISRRNVAACKVGALT